jgi:transposase
MRNERKRRNGIQRCNAGLKQFRGLATRYAKRAIYSATALTLAAIILWFRGTCRTVFS